MTQSELLRLERVEVDGLFNVYNHYIDLNLDDRVTILHGPNGVGKTVVLRMVDAFLRQRLWYFRTMPFLRFLLGFHDGSTLELRANGKSNPDGRMYKLTLTRGETFHEVDLDIISEADSVAAQVDYLRPHGSIARMWVDIRDGELLSESEVLRRFGGSSPSEKYDEEGMDWFSSFLENANTHLIEAQRLLRVEESESEHWRRFPDRFSRPSMTSSVVECSQDFRKRLDDTMAKYGRQSQTLDQSFPQRLISATDELTLTELQSRMSTLDEKTARLKEIGILDETPAHPFPVARLENIDSTQARVMTLYVRDTAMKLEALDELASRTRLLLNNVNEKFRHKRIRLDRTDGFVAESDIGQLLPLDSLSSGEQHELVLHYDLLFRVPSNTIVLMDEPELSLHVAWQKRFLLDLIDIIQLSDFDAMIATHSPFVVGDREDLMTGLGDSV